MSLCGTSPKNGYHLYLGDFTRANSLLREKWSWICIKKVEQFKDVPRPPDLVGFQSDCWKQPVLPLWDEGLNSLSSPVPFNLRIRKSGHSYAKGDSRRMAIVCR